MWVVQHRKCSAHAYTVYTMKYLIRGSRYSHIAIYELPAIYTNNV